MLSSASKNNLIAQKVTESIEINISSRRISELVTLHLKSCDATLTFFLGSYSEQIKAIQEYQEVN